MAFHTDDQPCSLSQKSAITERFTNGHRAWWYQIKASIATKDEVLWATLGKITNAQAHRMIVALDAENEDVFFTLLAQTGFFTEIDRANAESVASSTEKDIA